MGSDSEHDGAQPDSVPEDVPPSHRQSGLTHHPRWTHDLRANKTTPMWEDEIPAKGRIVKEHELLERARLRAVNHYRNNPENFGIKGLVIFTARNLAAAEKVIETMSTVILRTRPGDDKRWYLRRQRSQVIGLFTWRNEADMNEDQIKALEEFQARKLKSQRKKADNATAGSNHGRNGSGGLGQGEAQAGEVGNRDQDQGTQQAGGSLLRPEEGDDLPF